MAFEGAQMVPVYDMNKSDGDGFMGGGAGWMWVVMLFFLLAWGGGFGGFGGNGANGAVNTLTNEFLYTNLNNTIDRGFNQLANQNFGIQKDICESTGALQMGLCQGFNQTNAAIAESRFAAQQCCCETNRNIDAVRAENYKNTCEITFKKILSCACTESSFRGEYASSADSNRNYCLSGLYPHR